MILKNLFLSEFENRKFFGEKRFCFVDKKNTSCDCNYDEMLGELGEMKEEISNEINNQEKNKNKIDFDFYERNGDKFEKKLTAFEGFSGESSSYLFREILEKKDLLKNIAFFSNEKFSKDLYSKIESYGDSERTELLKSLGSDNLANLLEKAYQNEDKKSFNEYLDNAKKDFEISVKQFKKNFKKFLKEQKDNAKKRFEKTRELSRNSGGALPSDFETKEANLKTEFEKLERLEEKIFGENGKLDLEKILEIFKEKFNGTNSDFDKEIVKIKKSNDIQVNKKKAEKMSDEEIETHAFNNIFTKTLDKHFNGLDENYNVYNTENILSEMDNDIEYGLENKTIEDCKEICKEIPIEGIENECNSFFESDFVDFGFLDSFLKSSKFKIEENADILNNINSLKNEEKENFSNNKFVIGKFYKTLEKIRDIVYNKISQESSISKFIESENLDILKKEDREKILEKFLLLLEKDGISEEIKDGKISFSKSEKELDRADFNGLIEIINGDLESCNGTLKAFSSKDFQQFIVDKEGKKNKENIKLLYSSNLDYVNDLKGIFDGKINEIKEIEEKIESFKLENGDFNPNFLAEKEYLDELKKQKIQDLKREYREFLKPLKDDLYYREQGLRNIKTKHDKLIENEGPQPVTLASIIHMIKEVYGEWKGNIDHDKDVAKNRAAGVMAKGLGFTDAVNAGESMIKYGADKMREFYSSNKKKYSEYDISQLKTELNDFAKREGVGFNGTALYGVLANLAEKGGFSKDDKDFLIALHRKTGFLGDKAGNSYKSIEAAALEFIKNKTEQDKNEILSGYISNYFDDNSLYDTWVRQSKSAFQSSGKNAKEIRDELDDKYFEDIKTRYIQKAKEQNLLDENGCILDGRTVNFGPNDGIDLAAYQERLNMFVSSKIREGKVGFYQLIDGIATGMIPREFARTGIDGSLAGTFGWLDKFKKKLISYNEIKEIKNFFSKPVVEGGKFLDYTYDPKTNEEKRINKIIENRIGIWIKGTSDSLTSETSDELTSEANKWWMETTSGKKKYYDFEKQILGIGTKNGFTKSEQVSSFINGIGFEFEYLGAKDVDENGNILYKDLIDKKEIENIEETFKTFLAYYTAKIDGSYTGDFRDTDLLEKDLNSKPEKYEGSDKNGKAPSLKEQGDFFFEMFKEIDETLNEGKISKKIKLSDSDKKNEEKLKLINAYFGRGEGEYKNDIHKLFKKDPVRIYKIIRKFQDSSRFPHRTKKINKRFLK